MPLECLPADVAIDSSKENEFAHWPKRYGGPNRVEPICKPVFKPGFTLDQGDKVFTIGSCFARNVERALAARGFELPAWRIVKGDAEFEKLGTSILNNYAAPSIYNEISWALDPERQFDPERNFYEVFPGKYVDLHVARGIRPGPIELVKTRRDAITAVYREIVDCPLTVMTLGLTEAWYDCETELYLNTRPHQSTILKHPGRFELRVLDYADTIGFLGKTFDLLAANRKPGAHVLLTVSPVPLTTTYRNVDVIIANTYSKSVLRAAAEEIVSRYDFVEYYPSYESVTLTRRDLAWVDDQTHVQKDIIDVNVGRMVLAYTGGGGDTEASEGSLSENDQATLAGIREETVTDAATVFGFLDARPALVEADPQVAAALCAAALDLGKLSAADAAMRSIPDSWESVKRDLLKARLHLAKSEHPQAVGLLRQLVKTEQPRHVGRQLWQMLLEATLATEPADAGLRLLGEWKSSMRKIRNTEPFRLVALALDQAGDKRRAESVFREGLNCPTRANKHILADYIEFLEREGRVEEARRYLPTLDETTSHLSQRKEELARRLGLDDAGASTASDETTGAPAAARREKVSGSREERRQARLQRRKGRAEGEGQSVSRDERRERRLARRDEQVEVTSAAAS